MLCKAADKVCVLHASLMHLTGATTPTTLISHTLAGKASVPLLPQLAQSLPDWFEGTRHSSFLYVASELVKVFGSDLSHRQQLGGHQCLLHLVAFHHVSVSWQYTLYASATRHACSKSAPRDSHAGRIPVGGMPN